MILVYEQIRPSRVITEGAFSNGLHVATCRCRSSLLRSNGDNGAMEWQEVTPISALCCAMAPWRVAQDFGDLRHVCMTSTRPEPRRPHAQPAAPAPAHTGTNAPTHIDKDTSNTDRYGLIHSFISLRVRPALGTRYTVR